MIGRTEPNRLIAESEMNEEPRRVQPRRNIIDSGNRSLLKRYEGLGYWVGLAIVLMLVIWFIASSAADSGNSEDAEATVIATLFVPETATAEAELLLGAK